MPINVISQIKPINNAGFPVVEDIDIQGGYQIKDTTTDRDNIPEANRKVGMLVYVVADGKFYTLTGGVDNANWGESSIGSGGTVIPIGGELSGTYTSSVLCAGSASIVGNLEIQGDLVVLGTLYNDGGYQVDIKGSLHGQDIDFTKSDPNTPQSNFTVGGDFNFTDLVFTQCGGSAATLRIGGSLNGTVDPPGAEINGSAVDETSGLNITVFGDVNVGAINLTGGSSSSATPAGNGGDITVFGDANIFVALSLAGGSNSNGDAGDGGNISVLGDLSSLYISTFDLTGGNSTNGNAGSGGSLGVLGNVGFGPGSDISLNGGDCDSNDENHLSGIGGDILIYKSLTSVVGINLSGGNRTGNLTSSGSTIFRPNGGDLTVLSGATITGITSVGGNVLTTGGYYPCNSGFGGNIIVIGDLKSIKSAVLSYSIDLSGGDNDLGNSGTGGQISVGGDLSCDEDILANGGTTNGDAGDGGEINTGGYLYCGGNISLFGGTSSQGNGGNGGSIDASLDVNCLNIYLFGGNSTSSLDGKSAGNGGYIGCKSLNTTTYDIGSNIINYYDINVSAGNRSGSTTSSNTGNTVAESGKIIVRSDLFCGEIDGYGSTCLTNYPNSAGGNGASVVVNGNLKCNKIYLNGGDSAGNYAGDGGQLIVGGLASFYELNAIGGGSLDSVVGPDATTNGNGGNIEFSSGVCCSIINNNDGTGDPGSTEPSGFVNLLLSGNCSIGTIDSTDRSTNPEYVIIKPSSDEKNVILKINSMPNKVKLNNNDGTETGNISGDLDDSLFMSNSSLSASWHKVTGTGI